MSLPKQARRVWLVRAWNRYGNQHLSVATPFGSEAAAAKYVERNRKWLRDQQWDARVDGPYVLERPRLVRSTSYDAKGMMK